MIQNDRYNAHTYIWRIGFLGVHKNDFSFAPSASLAWTDSQELASMFSILETILSSVRKHRFSTFGDSVDRLNHQYTVILLLLLALAVCAKQYVGEPIQCWLPHEYRDTWEQYVETYCFVESTYFVPLEERVVEHSRLSDMHYRRVGYYQWVPIVLAVQAALFYAPHAMWKACSDLSGIRLQSIMKIAIDSSSAIGATDRNQRVRLLAQQIERALSRQQRHKISLFGHAHTTGLHLCTLYLLHKFFYLANSVVQFLLLNCFLNTDYDSWLWGVRILSDLTGSSPIEWTHSGHFPRLAVCNYPVRRKSENVWEISQCVLMINMLNEKIFVFLWFWLVLVLLLTLGNLISTFWSLCSTLSICRMAEEYLSGKADSTQIRRFVQEFLTRDGYLTLRFIQRCGDEVSSGQVIDALFDMFIQYDNQSHLHTKNRPISEKDLRKYGPVRVSFAKHPENRVAETIGNSEEEKKDVKLYCVDEAMESGQRIL